LGSPAGNLEVRYFSVITVQSTGGWGAHLQFGQSSRQFGGALVVGALTFSLGSPAGNLEVRYFSVITARRTGGWGAHLQFRQSSRQFGGTLLLSYNCPEHRWLGRSPSVWAVQPAVWRAQVVGALTFSLGSPAGSLELRYFSVITVQSTGGWGAHLQFGQSSRQFGGTLPASVITVRRTGGWGAHLQFRQSSRQFGGTLLLSYNCPEHWWLGRSSSVWAVQPAVWRAQVVGALTFSLGSPAGSLEVRYFSVITARRTGGWGAHLQFGQSSRQFGGTLLLSYNCQSTGGWGAHLQFGQSSRQFVVVGALTFSLGSPAGSLEVRYFSVITVQSTGGWGAHLQFGQSSRQFVAPHLYTQCRYNDYILVYFVLGVDSLTSLTRVPHLPASSVPRWQSSRLDRLRELSGSGVRISSSPLGGVIVGSYVWIVE
ncbi:hypothetical protein RRG08_066467, partial [Elysia crispata]